jgi:hypothetical protein
LRSFFHPGRFSTSPQRGGNPALEGKLGLFEGFGLRIIFFEAKRLFDWVASDRGRLPWILPKSFESDA